MATDPVAAKLDPLADYEPISVPVMARRLSERVWFVQGQAGVVSSANEGFNSNAGFVVTDDGVVVFDTLGSPSLGKALIEQIRSVTDQPIRRVIISHYHSDHFYGAQAFKAIGASIWAQSAAIDYLASDAPALRLQERRQSLFPWVGESTEITRPDVVIDGDRAFTLGGVNFRLLPVGPAHTPEDLMMFVEQEGALFAGDLVFAGRIPFVGTADSKAWLAALDDLSQRQAELLIPGHGPASRQATSDLDLTRAYLRALRKLMGAAVEDFVPFDEAYEQADWSEFEGLPAFAAANRRNAYNTYIRMEREALQADAR